MQFNHIDLGTNFCWIFLFAGDSTNAAAAVAQAAIQQAQAAKQYQKHYQKQVSNFIVCYILKSHVMDLLFHSQCKD